MSLLRFFSDLLPCKRIHEFIICKYLLRHESITLDQATHEIVKYIDTPSSETIEHSFDYLAQKFFDSSELKTYDGLLYIHENGQLRATLQTRKIYSDPEFNLWISDILHYGIIRYEEEFGNANYGVPHFKLYYQYSMLDTALLSNYHKKHSSFRGSGLITHGKDFFLFINLHKSADIKETINYQDKFITPKIFQWESPNTTSRDSVRGKDLVSNLERHVSLHVFVRKFEEIERVSQPFMYLGKAICQNAEGDKPIRMILAFEHEVPGDIYYEFVTKAD